ncbi:unnamed protein product [Rhizophagus irregularis]|nr:unnamed protein product [Rhizophagus irregularis]
MSCSKLFSGDLPELTNEIIKNFQNDYSTLYSCVLVNRLWCRLAIPLLWENPFSIPTRNYNFIEVYLYNLNDCLKSKLNEYHITDHYLLPSNTLFNYPSFIRYLSMCKIASSIDRWLEANDIIPKLNNRYSESIFEFKSLVEMLLIKLFVENEANLHTFEIKTDTYYNKYCDNILESILQNPNFINKIGNLKISILCSNTSTNDRISQIINSHQNLKRITLGCVGYDTLSFYQSLLLSKESNCSNTLNTIIFYYIDLKGQILPSKLEYLHLFLYIKSNDFEVFLKNSQDTFFKKLLINNVTQGDSSDDILPYIKEYIMKKKRVKYLAIKNSFALSFRNDIDLFNLKDEVKEFKLHNIKVLRYNDLYTYIYNFANEND